MRLVVFDATGTLLETAEPVGRVYAECARAAGAPLDPGAIEVGFAAAMSAAPPLAFGDIPWISLVSAERAWWRAVARSALEAAGAGSTLDFPRFFDLAWLRFAAPGAWRVHQDVRPALRTLRCAGVPLAVFSNWDHRLPRLLDGLGLGGFFSRITFSSAMPAAKPHPAAFDAACRAFARDLPLLAERPIMVGDRITHDVIPALAAGWGAVWLDRLGQGGELPAGAHRVHTLADLGRRIEAGFA